MDDYVEVTIDGKRKKITTNGLHWFSGVTGWSYVTGVNEANDSELRTSLPTKSHVAKHVERRNGGRTLCLQSTKRVLRPFLWPTIEQCLSLLCFPVVFNTVLAGIFISDIQPSVHISILPKSYDGTRQTNFLGVRNGPLIPVQKKNDQVALFLAHRRSRHTLVPKQAWV